MSASAISVSLVESFLPAPLVGKLQASEKPVSEKGMSTLSIVIVNLVLQTIEAMRKKNYILFDGNPGDDGCQCRALELRRLFQLDLGGESSALEKSVSQVKRCVMQRKDNQKEQKKCSPNAFFQGLLGQMKISKEMEFLLHCYLSKVFRTPYKQEKNGVIRTRSEVSKFTCLSKYERAIDLLGFKTRQRILELNQQALSKLSVESMRISACQTTLLRDEEKQLMPSMLSEANTHLFSPDPESYLPKYFGCLFYEVKTLLVCLKEEGGLVGLKSIVPQGETPFLVLLKPPAKNEEFCVLDTDAFTCLDEKMPLVVFEAVVKRSKEKTIEALQTRGFTEIILVEATKAPPYEPKSTLADIQSAEARKEINTYEVLGKNQEGLFELDHIYCNSLGAEIQSVGGK